MHGQRANLLRPQRSTFRRRCRPPRAGSSRCKTKGEARRVALSAQPVVVGASPSADLVRRGRHGQRTTLRATGQRSRRHHRGPRVAQRDLRRAERASTRRSAGRHRGGPRAIDARDRPAQTRATRWRRRANRSPGIAGSSIVMRRLADQVRRLARHALPVLIAGESGTGKELLARALHAEGPRRARPFVAINVTAVPRELVESELFGHERGAFTGAHVRREGAFADAEGGTLFLDEIGDLPLEAQPKILRALDGYEVRRVGGRGEWAQGRRARRGGHARAARAARDARRVPARPVPPARVLRRPRAAAARAARRHRRSSRASSCASSRRKSARGR